MMSAAPWKAGAVSAEWFRSFAGDYGPSTPGQTAVTAASSVASTWIVQLGDKALNQVNSVREIPILIACHGLPVRAVRGLGMAGQILVESPQGDPAVVLAALRSSPLVAHASPNGLLYGQRTVPNDPQFGQQLALDRPSNIDIDAPEAWDINTGGTSVVIAVIDSGVDYTHPDLAGNVWTNIGEVAGDGVDNDANGFIDDVRGFDFANGDGNPLDDNGHGTNVAGVIGARGNNAAGIAGVMWRTSILPLKHLNRDNVGTRDNAVAAINYATMMRQRGVNVQVINASWGDYGDFYQPMFDAISAAGDEGILFVAAAGNGNSLGRGIDLDRERTPFYPASYDLPNVISVGAAALDGTPASFSNYGRESVDLLAPGVGILTTERDGAFAVRNGTSFAAPFVSGVAGLIAANKPATPVSELRAAILRGATERPNLRSLVATGALLNAHGALTAETFAPRVSAAAIPVVTSSQILTINVTYTSNVNLDPQSFQGTGEEILVRRAGFRGHTEVLAHTTIQFVNPRRVDATYHFNVEGAIDNGSYQVIVRGNRVRDVNGLAAAERVLRSFQVNIDDPNVILVNTRSDTVDADPNDGVPFDINGKISLRSAIQHANATPDEPFEQRILVPDGLYLLTLGGGNARGEDMARKGDLDISGIVWIVGSGAEYTNITTQGRDRVFDVREGAFLLAKGLRVSGGREAVGGGIRNTWALDLVECTVDSNTADIAGGGIANSPTGFAFLQDVTIDGNTTLDRLTHLGGGGISNEGYLHIENSTLSNNKTAAGFTTLGGGGAIYNAGDQELFNVTVSGNSAAQGRGGGIFNFGDSEITHCTIVHNVAVRGGGLFNEAGASVMFKSTIVAKSAGAFDVNDVDGTGSGSFTIGAFAAQSYNFFGVAPSDAINLGAIAAPDQFGREGINEIDPLLGPLADNGGNTLTHLPLAGSPVVDAGDPLTTTLFDQIGNPRVDSDQDGSEIAEIGAVERFNSSIAGRIFDDLDGDGVFDANEPGHAGISVFLDVNSNRIFDEGELITTTVADDPATPLDVETGEYRFVHAAGFYVTQAERGSSRNTLMQRISLGRATAGAWTAAYRGEGTTPLPFDISAAALQSALQSLSTIGPGNVLVTGPAGGPYTIELLEVFTLDGITGNGDNLIQGASEISMLIPAGYGPTNPRGVSSGVKPTLTKVFDSSVPIIVDQQPVSPSRLWTPSIDVDGSVAFFAHRPEDDQLAIYYGKNERFESIWVGSFFDQYSVPFEQGAIAWRSRGPLADFSARFDKGVHVRLPDGSIETVADEFTSIPFSGGQTFQTNANVQFKSPRINQGIVQFVFSGDGDQAGQAGVYAGSESGFLARLVDTSYSNFFFDADVDGYNFAFRTYQDIFVRTDSSAIVPIVTHLTTPVPGVAGGVFDMVDGARPIASAGDEVAFYGMAREGINGPQIIQQGVYRASEDGVRRIADLNTIVPGQDTARFSAFGTGLSTLSTELSVEGALTVFMGALDDAHDFVPATHGIYCDIDGTLVKIIDTNDEIEGSRVTSLKLGNDAIAGNRITFSAVLADGREVVMVATLPYVSVQSVLIAAAQEVEDLHFGLLAEPGRLEGNVFEDLDADTVPDQTDPVLAGWTVFLDQNDNQQLDQGERSAATDALGNYAFDNLAASQTYIVRLQVQGNYKRIFPTNTDNGKWTVSLQPGESREGLDFAAVRTDGPGGVGTQSTLKGKVYLDANDNQQFDAGEGRAGWTVFIDANNNGFLDDSERRTLTLADNPGTAGVNEAGDYVFENLAAGSYEVRTLLPSDSLQSAPLSNRLRQRSPVSTLRAPTALALGDFNNDAKLDLVITSSELDSALILLNNGGGVFTQSKTIANVGSNPTAVAIGDLDGNSRNDIVIANQYANTLSILLNNNAAGVPFAAVRRINPGAGLQYSNSRGVALADFNKDGRLDIATANDLADKSVFIYHNVASSPGNFQFKQAVNAGQHAFAIAALHLNDDNGDGQRNDADHIDLVVANFEDRSITRLRNNGSRTFFIFGQPLQVGSGPASIAVGDFNGDGKPDLAVANYNSENVSILLASGNYNFAPAFQIGVPAGANSIVAGDIDGDADLDLVVAAGQTGASGGISVLRNRGNGRFGAAETQGVGNLGGIASFNVAAGAVDGGTTLDLVVTNGFQSSFSVLTNEILAEGGHNVELVTGLETVTGLDFLVRQQQTLAPTGVDLLPGSDKGVSSTDDLTNLDNSSATKKLQFRVTGTVPGATINLYANGALIGTAVATSASTVITTNGTRDLADGVRSIFARQVEAGKALSNASPVLSVRIDTVAAGSPGRPDLIPESDNGTRNDDNITTLSVLTFAGTASIGTTVGLHRNGIRVASGVANSQGRYLLTAGGFTTGTYTMTAITTDPAGNVSPSDLPLTSVPGVMRVMG